MEDMPRKSTIKIAENSNFFARLDIKGEKVWLVWGNPNQKRHNETLIKTAQLKKIRHSLSHFLDNLD